MIITTDHVQSLFSLPWHFLMGVDGGFIKKMTILVLKTMVLGMKPPNQCLEAWHFWRLPACLPAAREDGFHGSVGRRPLLCPSTSCNACQLPKHAAKLDPIRQKHSQVPGLLPVAELVLNDRQLFFSPARLQTCLKACLEATVWG